MGEKKKRHYTKRLIDLGGRQTVEVNNEFGDKQHEYAIVWLRCENRADAISIFLSPEEAISVAKMLYKIAYDTGYGPSVE